VLNHEHKGILYYPGDAVLLKNDRIGIIYNIQTTKLGITALVHEFTDPEKLSRLEFRGKKLNYEIAENELLYNTGGASEVSFKDFVRKVQVSNKQSSEYFCKRAIDIDRGNVFNVSWHLVERGQDLILDSPKKNSSPASSKNTKTIIVVDDETMVDSIDEQSECQDEGKETVEEVQEKANEISGEEDGEGAKQTSDEEFQELKESSSEDQDVQSDGEDSEDSVESSGESKEAEEVDSDDIYIKFKKGRKRKPKGSKMDKIRHSAKPVIKKPFKFTMNDIRESRKLPPNATIYQKARDRLYLSYTPESLPCREKEFDEIYMFLEELIEARSGACIYISGVPGTGKTATVYSVINAFQKQMQEKVWPILLTFRRYLNVS
jgi:hypothetical protein